MNVIICYRDEGDNDNQSLLWTNRKDLLTFIVCCTRKPLLFMYAPAADTVGSGGFSDLIRKQADTKVMYSSSQVVKLCLKIGI